ncbi:MAG: hypothetical protein J6J36_03180 [Clostridia bacterium]|nr:hypothetical protein [Clostridia bacterium]MBP3707598.1 hypothetical protein [Clostridia bacterium]
MKKILILYAAYGGGHLSAAKSIKNYIDKNYPDTETELVDCVKYINKSVDKITTGAYKELTKKAPWAWKKVYYKSRKGLLGKFSSATNSFLAHKLLRLYNEYKPNLVISTHPFATQMTGCLKKHDKITCKLATILTDFAPHNQWLIGHEYCDYFFVSHEQMKKALINDYGVFKEKIYVTGIPLSDRFNITYDKNTVCKEFGLNPDKKTILFFGGGEFGLGKDKTIAILKVLVTHLDKYQIIAVSGKNAKMNSAFWNISNELGNPPELKIFDFITNVPEAMSISNLVITKPGGLTTSESLASSLPILVINPIPGQEEENAEFLEQAGAALWLRPTDNIEIVIKNLLNSSEALERMKESCIKLAHTDATKNICEILLQ